MGVCLLKNTMKTNHMISKYCFRFALAVSLGCMSAGSLQAAQLANDARAAIPREVQQLISVDYRAMQNSQAAMDLKSRVLPPELKQLETALRQSGLNDTNDVDELAFASFRTPGSSNPDDIRIIGLAQGEFSLPDILANFRKHKIKPTLLRANKIYTMGNSGMLVSFLNPTTMVFGSKDALTAALDARDGLRPSFLANEAAVQQMEAVDSEPVWSILDQKGTQTMMRSVMGEAAQLSDFDTVKKRLLSSRYTMNFQNGVKFSLDVITPDTFTAATMSSLMNAAAMYKKMSGTPIEQQAIDNTKIDSSAGILEVRYASSDNQFSTLLHSSLFQTVVH